MVKKRGLGKSLDALLAYTTTEINEDDTVSPATLTHLPITQLQRGKYQPRREMDPQALEELANSIRAQGILQPLIVRPVEDRYEIIAGERRYRAAELVGLNEVPVIIRDIPDEAALAIALIENIQRENLNPVEEAIALQRLSDEFGMTHSQLADAIGKSRTSVTNLLRLLILPQEIKDLLERGLLEMGHARTLITLPADLQLEAAKMITAKQMSVRETEHFIRRLQNTDFTTNKKAINPDIRELQDNLSKQLQMRVSIQCNAKGKGKLIIHYKNLNELDQLLAQFEVA